MGFCVARSIVSGNAKASERGTSNNKNSHAFFVYTRFYQVSLTKAFWGVDVIIPHTPMDKMPTFVYHYTSLKTLISLIENIQIEPSDKRHRVFINFWATSAFYLNDPNDYVYLHKDCMQGASEIGKSFARFNVGSPFVISFSECADSIPMWMSYANEGNGVCLKLSTSNIKGSIKESQKQNRELEVEFKKCCYDKPTPTDPLYSNVNKSSNLIVESNDIKQRLLIAAFYKSKDWEYEKEWRLLLGEHFVNNIHFRGDNNLIPYIEVFVPIDLLNGIIVGPKVSNESYKAVELAIMKLKDKTGQSNIKLERSSIKMR